MSKNSHLLTDISLQLLHHSLRPVYKVATQQTRFKQTHGSRQVEDFASVSGNDNLAQAIVLRLLTPRGELSELAHPEYGSRLHELIGRPNTATTHNLIRLFTLEALGQERRIERITTIEVYPASGTRDQVRVDLQVLPVGSDTVIDIEGIELTL